jgi:hypothetical protein
LPSSSTLSSKKNTYAAFEKIYFLHYPPLLLAERSTIAFFGSNTGNKKIHRLPPLLAGKIIPSSLQNLLGVYPPFCLLYYDDHRMALLSGEIVLTFAREPSEHVVT